MTELILSEKPLIRLIHGDCMAFMSGCNAEQFDLACTDPPYGIGDKFKGGKSGKMNFNEIVNKKWDEAPTPEYFTQLQWVSKNQIIWGGNYFQLPPTRCMIVWDKIISEDFSLAMAELAWTSFDSLTKIIRLQVPKTGKQHPTQKPIALYKWLLSKYAKPGDTILDTHGGSMSSVIAAYDMGFDITCIEMDKDYFDAAVKRIKRFMSEPKIDFAGPKHGEQTTLI